MTVRNYAILYVGGKRTRGGTVVGGGTIVEGGNGVLDTEPHALDGLEHTNRDSYTKAIGGGEDTIHAHGAAGATETIDPALGNVHTLTLDANCTFTLTAPTAGVASLLEIRVLQDGTGGWTITWPGSVSWVGGTTPTPITTAATTSVYLIESLDGGTSWLGALVGGGGGATGAAGGDLSGTYPNPSVIDDSHSHTAATLPAASSTGGEIVIASVHSSPLIFDDLVQNSDGDDLVYASA